jgi:hypothetical protein
MVRAVSFSQLRILYSAESLYQVILGENFTRFSALRNFAICLGLGFLGFAFCLFGLYLH